MNFPAATQYFTNLTRKREAAKLKMISFAPPRETKS